MCAQGFLTGLKCSHIIYIPNSVWLLIYTIINQYWKSDFVLHQRNILFAVRWYPFPVCFLLTCVSSPLPCNFYITCFLKIFPQSFTNRNTYRRTLEWYTHSTTRRTYNSLINIKWKCWSDFGAAHCRRFSVVILIITCVSCVCETIKFSRQFANEHHIAHRHIRRCRHDVSECERLRAFNRQMLSSINWESISCRGNLSFLMAKTAISHCSSCATPILRSS